MKFIFSLFLIYTNCAIAWDLPNVGNFKFERIGTTNIHIMHGPLSEPTKENTGFMNNPVFIESNNGLILIDPGSTYQVGKNVLIEIKKISTKPILAVINTHIHGDHWFANQAIKEAYPKAKFYGSKRMIQQANGEKAIIWLNSMHRMTEGLSKDTIITPPTLVAKHKQIIKVDGQTFIIHEDDKAHTDTDIIIEHPQSNTVFTGDNAFNRRFGQFDASSDINGNIKALEYAKDLNAKYYIPGHGASGTYAKSIQPYLNYLIKLKQAVSIGYEEGLEDFEVKEKVLLEFMEYSNWAGFDIVFGKHVLKMYAEIENASW